MIRSIASLFRNDRWIPASFVLFFIGLAGVEGVLITLSLNSFTGLSETDPYRRGLDYNKTIAARDRDRALGWRVSVGFEPEGALRGLVKVAARDAAGSELKGARVSGTAEHPVGGKEPVKIAFGSFESGSAEGALAVDAPGRWFLRVRIEDNGESIERRREIFIEPR